MKIVTLEVRAPGAAMADFVQAWKTRKAQRHARIAFATPELLWKVLTALFAAGVLNRTETGAVEFPFEAVKVEFLLEAAWLSPRCGDNHANNWLWVINPWFRRGDKLDHSAAARALAV